MALGEGGLRVRKHCAYSRDRHFVRILVKMTKNFGPRGGVSDPHIPPWLRPCITHSIDPPIYPALSVVLYSRAKK